MNDCTNAEIRDRLPELLHERLNDGVRAQVMAHLADCVDCRDELALLAEVRAAIEARTPRVDLNFVMQALPKPPAQSGHAVAAVPGVVRLDPRRRVWADWRVAAAVTLLVAGGSSVALLNRGPSATESSESIRAASSTVTASASTTRVPDSSIGVSSSPNAAMVAGAAPRTQPAPTVHPSATEVAATTADQTTPAVSASDASLSNLSESQLKALLQDIDKLPAVPVAEPEPVSLRINTRTSGDI